MLILCQKVSQKQKKNVYFASGRVCSCVWDPCGRRPFAYGGIVATFLVIPGLRMVFPSMLLLLAFLFEYEFHHFEVEVFVFIFIYLQAYPCEETANIIEWLILSILESVLISINLFHWFRFAIDWLYVSLPAG